MSFILSDGLRESMNRLQAGFMEGREGRSLHQKPISASTHWFDDSSSPFRGADSGMSGEDDPLKILCAQAPADIPSRRSGQEIDPLEILSMQMPCSVSSISILLKDFQSFRSITKQGSIRSSTLVVPEATILLIDIKNFTAECAKMQAGHVGEWVAAFCRRVDAAASAHGVTNVEVRGDCCVCVAGAEGAAPSRRRRRKSAAAVAAADLRDDQATRMLAFAAQLHADLADFAGSGGGPTMTRMGVATGALTLLTVDGAAVAAGFTSAQGDVVGLAAQMEALAEPGRARVHQSTAARWAAETGRRPPATVRIECGELGAQCAAAFDCAAQAFLPAPTPPTAAAASRARGAATRMRANLSALF